MQRRRIMMVVGLLCCLWIAGCRGDDGKKGANKDLDRPQPEKQQEKK